MPRIQAVGAENRLRQDIHLEPEMCIPASLGMLCNKVGGADSRRMRNFPIREVEKTGSVLGSGQFRGIVRNVGHRARGGNLLNDLRRKINHARNHSDHQAPDEKITELSHFRGLPFYEGWTTTLQFNTKLGLDLFQNYRVSENLEKIQDLKVWHRGPYGSFGHR